MRLAFRLHRLCASSCKIVRLLRITPPAQALPPLPSLMLSSCAGTSGCKMCRARGRPLPRFVSRSDLAAAGARQPRILARLGKLAVSLAQHPTELRVPPVVNRW